MADVKVKLLRPLDGQPEGGNTYYPEADAKRLAERGLVEIVAVKAEPAPRNKAEPAPSNKAIG